MCASSNLNAAILRAKTMSNEPPRDPQPPPTSAANTDGPPAQRGEKRKRKRKSNQMLSQQTPDAKHLDANQSPSVEGIAMERGIWDDKPEKKNGKKQKLSRDDRRKNGLFRRVKDDKGNDTEEIDYATIAERSLKWKCGKACQKECCKGRLSSLTEDSRANFIRYVADNSQ